MATRQPKRRDVVDGVFEALLKHARDRLGQLRDDDVRVEEWAERQLLSSPFIVEHAKILRLYWGISDSRRSSLQKSMADSLDLECLGIVVMMSDDKHAWIRDNVHVRNLPDPFRETQRQWLIRAGKLYRDRAAIGLRRVPLRPEFPKHCEWFVKVQVLGIRPSRLARTSHCDRAAVERETRKIASLLRIPRRTWRRGRSRKVSLTDGARTGREKSTST